MDAVCPCWLKKLVEKRGKGGGGDPFAQGWTHTDRRIRRFFQKPVASVVVVSFLDIEPHELSRSSFSAGGLQCTSLSSADKKVTASI